MKHTYTEVQLREAISKSTSIRAALIYLNISARGGNYKVIQKAVARYNIDTSHFLGQGHAKNKTLPSKTETNLYLTNVIPISSFRLKNRLLKENILSPVCTSCGLENWLGRSIPLELDHIDGNSDNNNLQNLRLLCPNCHALTPTYRGKNQKRARA